jgi:hypothetical protein
MRRFLLPLVIVVAIVAIAIPTCRMVGCDMGDMGAMSFVPFGGTHASAMCPGQWEYSSSPAGIVPSGGDPLVIGFFAALVAAIALLVPQRSARPTLACVGDSPPPRQAARGERFRV